MNRSVKQMWAAAATAAAAGLGFLGCGGGSSGGGGIAPIPAAIATPIVTNYADLMLKKYTDVEALALQVQAAVATFTADPTTNGNLEAAQAAWKAARRFYQRTEIGRFYDGPIDRAPDGPEGFLNAWPLDEAYIDSVAGSPGSGFINDTAFVITATTVRDANENGGDTNISTGWHAIEFMLWGQDDPSNVDRNTNPGTRPVTDFEVDAGSPTDIEQRRSRYLNLLCTMLVADIQQVKAEWAPGNPSNYRAEILAALPNEQFRRIMTGVGSLAFGELRGERIIVQFDTQNQEDEHSCFSDTTHFDHLDDMIGVEEVWTGDYDASNPANDLTGPGLRDLAVQLAPDLVSQMDGHIAACKSALAGIVPPFDQAVLGSNPARRAEVQAAIDALSAFNDSISAVAARLGVPVQTTLSQ